MMKRFRVAPAFLLLVLACPLLGAEKFALDSAHSKVGFTATLAGVSDVEGRFTDVAATILYDEADLTKSSATVIIKSASIDTADSDRDRDLKDAAFFDVQKFPIIRFQSARVEKRPKVAQRMYACPRAAPSLDCRCGSFPAFAAAPGSSLPCFAR